MFDPYDEYEALILDRTADIVGACEEVAAAELPRHSRVATEALNATRAPDDAPAGGRASVTRRNGSLLASVGGLDDLAPRQRDAAIVRMIAKLRELDSSARGIDVVVAPPV